ncbi:MAG TPA: DNA adenine methylase [Chloroflexia bacterium]|nr:DNA adenine methylase [Chloroflexia bacterium]
MRYIGSKDRLLPFIQQALDDHAITGGTFCDAFSGTTVVARHAKSRGYRVVANDLLFFSYVLQRAYLCCNAYPAFAQLGVGGDRESPAGPLAAALCYLNALPPVPGFVYTHYSPAGPAGRRYLSPVNAGRIDAIRGQIAAWEAAGQLEGEEPYVLLAALIEAVPFVSNISGTYGAFLKAWDPRAHKPLVLRPPRLLAGTQPHAAYQRDATTLVREIACDVLYLDPPYNSRPYASNYHLLETVARADAPAVYGKTGLRPYAAERSAYNGAAAAAAALRTLVAQARCTHLLLSYNSEGLIPESEILAILAGRGTPEVRRRPYRRFRSDTDARRRYAPQHEVSENLYYVRCET